MKKMLLPVSYDNEKRNVSKTSFVCLFVCLFLYETHPPSKSGLGLTSDTNPSPIDDQLTNAIFTLYWIAFTPPRKPYRIVLLSITLIFVHD